MRIHFYIIVLLFSISCGDSSPELDSTDSGVSELIIEDTTIAQTDGQILSKVDFPEAVLNDPCLPYPSAEFLYNLQYDSLHFKYSEEYNLMYNYLVAHFDSLGAKKYYEVEDEWGMGKYHWEQYFSNGIKYVESYGGEGGSVGVLYTECTDRVAIYSTLNCIINYDYELAENEYDDEATWNDDSTEFAPNGAGCYYTIIKNDSSGFYYIDNYCGC